MSIRIFSPIVAGLVASLAAAAASDAATAQSARALDVRAAAVIDHWTPERRAAAHPARPRDRFARPGFHAPTRRHAGPVRSQHCRAGFQPGQTQCRTRRIGRYNRTQHFQHDSRWQCDRRRNRHVFRNCHRSERREVGQHQIAEGQRCRAVVSGRQRIRQFLERHPLGSDEWRMELVSRCQRRREARRRQYRYLSGGCVHRQREWWWWRRR